MAVISASAFCTSADIARRFAPIIFVSTANSGTMPTATSVSCQERIDIATTVLMRITMLDRMSVMVLVTTVWTPPTSLVTRD